HRPGAGGDAADDQGHRKPAGQGRAGRIATQRNCRAKEIQLVDHAQGAPGQAVARRDSGPGGVRHRAWQPARRGVWGHSRAQALGTCKQQELDRGVTAMRTALVVCALIGLTLAALAAADPSGDKPADASNPFAGKVLMIYLSADPEVPAHTLQDVKIEKIW